jgi:hypothetical protein
MGNQHPQEAQPKRDLQLGLQLRQIVTQTGGRSHTANQPPVLILIRLWSLKAKRWRFAQEATHRIPRVPQHCHLPRWFPLTNAQHPRLQHGTRAHRPSQHLGLRRHHHLPIPHCLHVKRSPPRPTRRLLPLPQLPVHRQYLLRYTNCPANETRRLHKGLP